MSSQEQSTASKLAKAARGMQRPELQALWSDILAGKETAWAKGKALEHLVLRAFELDGAQVTYPYSVRLGSTSALRGPRNNLELEQIDGMVRVGEIRCICEAKDRTTPQNSESLSKLRNQLLRRPRFCIGSVFSKRGFTASARVAAHFMIEHPILLWNAEDISWALSAENGFARALEMKLRVAIEHGLPDFFVGSHELASVSPDPLEPGPPVDVVSGARVIVIVEGENDRVLLTKLLDTRFDRSAYRVVPARGKEAAQALARSLAAVGRTAVVLMFDADTREAEGIALQKAEAEDALQLAAGDDMSLVVVLAPELEALVLRPDAFALAFPGEPPLDSNEEELATDRPRRVLEHRLGGTGRGQFFSRLSPSTIEKIAQDPQLEALFAFVASHVGPSGAVRHP